MRKYYTRFGMNKRNLYELLKQRDGLICHICGESLEKEYEELQIWYEYTFDEKEIPENVSNKKRSKININVDHVIPWSISKNNDKENLRLSHKDCNTIKGNSINY